MSVSSVDGFQSTTVPAEINEITGTSVSSVVTLPSISQAEAEAAEVIAQPTPCIADPETGEGLPSSHGARQCSDQPALCPDERQLHVVEKVEASKERSARKNDSADADERISDL
ncbi:hypothetical protein MMC28_004113 [Mycoblastus sanguinarius]|nr:hypothetical protein [Mycoblastus sanguinarius]